MNELLAEGMSIIMVSSELPELLGMCDRFVVMSHGKIVPNAVSLRAVDIALML